MTHDFSHLDDAATEAIYEINANERGCVDSYCSEGHAARRAILSALTQFDIAALIAEKCPGWVCVPEKPWHSDDPIMHGFIVTTNALFKAQLDAAPKLGE